MYSADPGTHHEHILLSVAATLPRAQAPKGEPYGEAADTIRSMRWLAEKLDNIQALATDGVLRGTHYRTLMRELGIIPCSKVTAAEAGTDTKARKPKKAFLGPHLCTRPDRTKAEVDITAIDGSPHIQTVTVDGEVACIPLIRKRLYKRGHPGAYRFYSEWDIPDDYGGGTVRLAHLSSDAGIANGHNREEVLRPIPPGDPYYRTLQGHRQGAEMMNSTLQYPKPRGRACTYSLDRQLIEVLAFQLANNARALCSYRKRTGAQPPG